MDGAAELGREFPSSALCEAGEGSLLFRVPQKKSGSVIGTLRVLSHAPETYDARAPQGREENKHAREKKER